MGIGRWSTNSFDVPPPPWAVFLIGAVIEAETGAPRFADIRAWAGKKPPDGGEVELAPAPKRTRKNQKSVAGDDCEVGEAGVGDADAELKKQEVVYFVGWDSEQESAWRLVPKAPSSSKEFTKDLVENDEADDDDLCIARWKDGYVKELAALTYGQLRISLAAKKQAGVRGSELWTNKAETLTIRMKCDRKKLIWLREVVDGKSNQICQVAVDNMKSQEDAVKLMTVIALEYDSGKLERGDLYTRRDCLMEEYLEEHMPMTGAGSSSTAGVMKRPAAAKTVVKNEAAPENKTEEAQLAVDAAPAPAAPAPSTPPKRSAKRAKAKAVITQATVLYKADFDFATSALDVFAVDSD